MKHIEVMKLALEVLEDFVDDPRCQKQIDDAITALRQALDKMAENARELGLDYEPAGGTQVSKVWWDGDKLIAKPIPLSEVYKEPEQQPAAVDVKSTESKETFDKQWVGLTDEEISKAFHPLHDTALKFARAIEAKLKEKNSAT